MESIVAVNNISKYYKCHKNKILDNISFYVKYGEVVGIIGPSGCGKTTLLKIISELESYDEGEIICRYNNLAYVFQDDRILPWLTVKDNIRIILQDKKDNNYIETVLSRIGLADYIDYRGWQLSGGMKKRLEIARAIAIKPDIILFDEPLANLDYLSTLKLIKEIKSLISNNIAAIYVTHDIREVLSIADRIIVLSKPPSYVIKIISVPNNMNIQQQALLEQEIYSLLV